MRLNNGVLAAIIGAVGAVIAAYLTSYHSASKPTTQAIQQEPSGPAPSSNEFTPRALSADYHPTGWMGDGEQGEKYLIANSVSATIDGASKAALCFTYTRGQQGWAGVYWLHPDNNWGNASGIDLHGAANITFFARGKHGGELVEFISGGIKGNQYSDSYRVSTGQLRLRRQWTEYSLDLKGRDLTSVIGAFAWSAPSAQSGSLEFCVADIQIR